MQSPSSEAKILRESHDRENAEHSLIKHDISRACDCPEGECSRRAEELIEALYYVSPSAYNAMILQLARIPNYTDLLDEISEATGPVELASTTSPTANVLNPTDTAQCRACHTNQADKHHLRFDVNEVRPDEHLADVSGSSTAKNKSRPPHKVLSIKEKNDLVNQYHEDQSKFERFLYNLREHVRSNKKSHFESMFSISIGPWNHPEVFQMVSEISGRPKSADAAKLLEKMIANREKVRRHCQSLPVRNPCLDNRHQRFLQILKDGQNLLVKWRVHSLEGTQSAPNKRQKTA